MAIPAPLTAVKLVHQAHAFKRVYQQTWCLEDLESQIHCYLQAISLLYGGDDRIYASVTPALKNSVANEPFERREYGHRPCAISEWLWTIIQQHPSHANFPNRYTSIKNRI